MSEQRWGGAGTAPSPWVMAMGGAAALLLAAGYIATMPLFSIVGAPPEGTLERIEYHTTGTTAWWGIVALSILTDLLFVPVSVALYVALGRTSQPAMLVSVGFVLLFVALDLAVLWPAKVALITLGDAYATATVDERASLVAAAGYPSVVLDSVLTAIYSVLTLGIGILGVGLVMLRSSFGRTTASVGVATGLVSIASVAETILTGAFPVLVVVASLLTIIWLILTGYGLLRLRVTSA